MNKVAHTPGPWQSMHAGTANDEHARCIRSYGGAWIANVLKQGTEADRAANARLIAAAPDLLAALTQLRDLRNQWRNDDRYSSIDYMDAIDALPWEAAIARAEGGGE